MTGQGVMATGFGTEYLALLKRCRDCGGPVERADAPLPAYAAPVPWWFHASEAQAQRCPGSGPVRPVSS